VGRAVGVLLIVVGGVRGGRGGVGMVVGVFSFVILDAVGECKGDTG
jgi:hypothetical protein